MLLKKAQGKKRDFLRTNVFFDLFNGKSGGYRILYRTALAWIVCKVFRIFGFKQFINCTVVIVGICFDQDVVGLGHDFKHMQEMLTDKASYGGCVSGVYKYGGIGILGFVPGSGIGWG